MIFCIILSGFSFFISLFTGMSIAHERKKEDELPVIFSKQGDYYFLPVPIFSESEDKEDTQILFLIRNISCAIFWLSLVGMAVIKIVTANDFY